MADVDPPKPSLELTVEPEPTARMRVRVVTIELEGTAIDASTVLGTVLQNLLEGEGDGE